MLLAQKDFPLLPSSLPHNYRQGQPRLTTGTADPASSLQSALLVSAQAAFTAHLAVVTASIWVSPAPDFLSPPQV